MQKFSPPCFTGIIHHLRGGVLPPYILPSQTPWQWHTSTPATLPRLILYSHHHVVAQHHLLHAEPPPMLPLLELSSAPMACESSPIVIILYQGLNRATILTMYQMMSENADSKELAYSGAAMILCVTHVIPNWEAVVATLSTYIMNEVVPKTTTLVICLAIFFYVLPHPYKSNLMLLYDNFPPFLPETPLPQFRYLQKKLSTNTPLCTPQCPPISQYHKFTVLP